MQVGDSGEKKPGHRCPGIELSGSSRLGWNFRPARLPIPPLWQNNVQYVPRNNPALIMKPFPLTEEGTPRRSYFESSDQ